MIRMIAYALTLLLALAAGPLAAQEQPSAAAPAQPPAGATLLDTIKQAAAKAERLLPEAQEVLAAAQQKLARPDIDAAALDALRVELDALRQKLLEERKQLAEQMARVQAQLAVLGEAPKDGAAEPPDIAAQRQALEAVSSRLKAVDGKLGLMVVEADQLTAQAAARLRAQFFSDIFAPARSVLNPLLWREGLETLPLLGQRLVVLLNGWQRNDTMGGTRLTAVAALFVGAFVLLVLLWRRWRWPMEHSAALTDMHRLWRAIKVALLALLLMLALLVLVSVIMRGFGLPSPRIAALFDALATAAMFTVVVAAMARGIFRPRAAHMRLVNIDDAGARRAYRTAALIAFLAGADIVAGALSEILFLPVAFTVAWGAAFVLAQAALILRLVFVVRKATPLEDEGQATRRFFFIFARYLVHPVLLVVLAAVLALLPGYIALGHFIITQLIVTAVLVAALYLVHHLADELVRAALNARTVTGRFLRQGLLLQERTVSRLGVAFSTIVDIAIVLVGIPLVLLQWAVNWTDLRIWAQQVFFGFKVGNITIEPAAILLAIGVLIAGIVLARLLVMWLDRRVLARTEMDSGIRHSITAVARYAGFVAAFLVALSVAGFNLTSLAIFGGALGIGIGFGLQTIVNNFVSGLILLAERPIKVGDWIRTSGGEGVVRKIKVRSTEIETFDRCSVIIPNSALISEPVSNWYHASRMGRIRLTVGVSYDADPDEVRDILLACAKEHPRAVAYPEPYVLFTGFGDSSLDFELRVYIDDAGLLSSVASDLRFAIFRRLKEAGIEIPFPQRDVNVRQLPPELLDHVAKEADSGAE